MQIFPAGQMLLAFHGVQGQRQVVCQSFEQLHLLGVKIRGGKGIDGKHAVHGILPDNRQGRAGCMAIRQGRSLEQPLGNSGQDIHPHHRRLGAHGQGRGILLQPFFLGLGEQYGHAGFAFLVAHGGCAVGGHGHDIPTLVGQTYPDQAILMICKQGATDLLEQGIPGFIPGDGQLRSLHRRDHPLKLCQPLRRDFPGHQKIVERIGQLGNFAASPGNGKPLAGPGGHLFHLLHKIQQRSDQPPLEKQEHSDDQADHHGQRADYHILKADQLTLAMLHQHPVEEHEPLSQGADFRIELPQIFGLDRPDADLSHQQDKTGKIDGVGQGEFVMVVYGAVCDDGRQIKVELLQLRAHRGQAAILPLQQVFGDMFPDDGELEDKFFRLPADLDMVAVQLILSDSKAHQGHKNQRDRNRGGMNCFL